MRIELTNECNLNCSYCHANPNSIMGVIPIEFVERAIASSLFHPELGQITISGGEAFLYPDHLLKVLSLLRKNDFTDIRVQTNGTLFTQDILDELKSFQGVSLKISLDSHDQNVHNARRQLFLKTIYGIRLGVENGFKVGTTCVLTPHNYLGIQAYIDFCKELGIKNIQFRRELGVDTGLTQEILSAIIASIDNAKSHGIKITKKSCLKDVHGCLGRFCLSVEGNIYPCGNVKIPLINIRDLDDFSQIELHPVITRMGSSGECTAVMWSEGRF